MQEHVEVEVEFFILVDEEGNYSVSDDDSDTAERYAENHGNDNSYAKRILKLTVNVPMPKKIEASATLPETGGEFTLTVNPAA